MAYLVIDSQLFGIGSNRLAILWFIDSRIFGALNEINDLIDSRFTVPTGFPCTSAGMDWGRLNRFTRQNQRGILAAEAEGI
jgi:hypothetical protein